MSTQESSEARNRSVTQVKKNETSRSSGEPSQDLIYSIEDVPPWYLSLIYGFQHYLTMVGGTISNPIVLASFLCIADDNPARGALVSTIIFMSGIATLLQSTLGVRLPIIQGGNFAYLLPTVVIINTTFEPCSSVPMNNLTFAEQEEVWQVRMREVQGAITLSALFQVIIGFTGMIGLLLKWITPLTVVPTITLVGMSLFDLASNEGSGHWGICLMTVALTVVFSQHMKDLPLPFPAYKKGHGLLIAITISWGLCAVLTSYDMLPKGSAARTDNSDLLSSTPWFRVPYPGQWGLPSVSVAGTVGMLAAVISSIIESVGDYYACARVAEAPIPPTHAINRGIGVEGLGCMLAGLCGSGSGTTSYSGNIGILSITKVASRRMIQYSALIMLVCGVVAKIGAIFVTIPGPVIAGVFYIKFSIITAVGISTLHYVDLTSSRNLFVLGFSIFFGLSVPKWLEANPSYIQTGAPLLDQTLLVLLQTPMFLGGFLGLVLDNTISGTDEERGLLKWKGVAMKTEEEKQEAARVTSSCYDLPFGTNIIKRMKWTRFIPFCPSFEGYSCRKSAIKDRVMNGMCLCQCLTKHHADGCS
ncbi:Solute carrier family 23 member 1-like 5 [Homarus americanus]|uniref:Solute carrier family 23 member 1-like 5 n=1 Tax=Homarus americanus TaxID=6706 RepID=A0A8J5MY43_HOMAM|nr:Solute carrier family 23 member 1-like 5 [Homarus americanus]